MKIVSSILGAGAFIATSSLASSSYACTITAASSSMELGNVTDGKVISRMFGPLGEIKGNDVYNNEHQLVGSVIGHKVAHPDGSFAAFVAGGQLLNSQSQKVAVASACTPTEAGAAYLLMFH